MTERMETHVGAQVDQPSVNTRKATSCIALRDCLRAGRSLVAILAAIVSLSSATRAAADDDFYSGKMLKLVVSATAGGGYDNIARAFMRHFVGQIPGKPMAQVVNMQGGGGIVMSNWAYNVAPRDGTVLGMPNLSMVMDQVIAPGTVKYDAARFNWIGNIEPQEMSLFTWRTSPTKTIEDARLRETVMAASSKGSPLQQILTLSNITLGTKFRIVLGYLDTRVLAVERGEVEGSASSIQNFAVLAPQWLENNASSINVLAVNAAKRSPKFPNAPTMIELAKTQEHRDMLEFMMLQGLTGRSIFTPPDVPHERIAILRTAFDATMRDPVFLEDMRKLKVEVDWTPGPEVAASVRRVIGASPQTAERVLKALE